MDESADLDEGQEGAEDASSGADQLDGYLLGLARQAYHDSTDFVDSNCRRQWEKSISHFRGEHASGSKYSKAEFKNGYKPGRFFPKTRAVIKSGEASVAAAMFSSADLVNCQPGDDDNPMHVLSADVHQSLMQYRLEKTIPWFLTCVGAYQLAATQGMCVSYNWWKYESVRDTTYQPAVDEFGSALLDGQGQQVMRPVETRKVICDEPRIDLVALENVRFSPDADWRDPLQSSPYLIIEVSMTAGDVVRQMEDAEAFGQSVRWRKYSLETVVAQGKTTTDTTRQARAGQNRTDPADANTGVSELTTVWLRKVFMRLDGIDYLFWTIGDNLLLADPVRADDVYFHGKRPYTFGLVNIEALRNYPAGTAELISSLQEETNDIRNQRRTNVDLSLNKRFLIRRGEAIDIQALMRNVPGGGIAVDDPDKSVREMTFNDVTGSSYHEQDRVDLAIDEISGNFSQTSVMSNRQLNETVGGMRMLGDNAFAMQDYGVRIFVETWVEKTLEQLRMLEAFYETDGMILGLAASKADAYRRLGISSSGRPTVEDIGPELMDKILQQDIAVRVNVGMGATTPERRLQRIVTALQTTYQLAPSEAQRMKADEIYKEVFGIAGYKNGSRFRMSDEELDEHTKKNPPGLPPEIEAKMAEIKARAEADRMEHERAMAKLSVERELALAKLALDQNLKMSELETKLGISAQQDKTRRDVATLAHVGAQEQRQLNRDELDFKRNTGQPGI